ncbi:uncharacterized protein BDR25DRAFT_304222 [Lindgomyces ingoldianus]|uniref:Uncharacterized protein n=1 Tax=Lindgomyces ingoldianus TaxID=673940 RepID=A0ACB6QS21_9PLEO|nr:uncharacterized protein BDR25DRAFT_304222 [Lindgomyces ingoldianus]KAF2469783.1 hypothetical protein BDR25DRAFT_304222 [Lindgomyces ingoldianus]
MFNSDWKFDTLVEKHISEVEMPTAIYIRNPDTKQLENYRGPRPGGADPLPDLKVLTRTPWPGALVQGLPPTVPASESMSYIVRTHPMRGKFDPNRAKELGVKPGRDFATLTTGASVRNAKGETITSDMVLGPERPGQGFAVLDVPSVEYIEPVVNREELLSCSVMQDVQACIWILGPGVSGHPILQQFMQRLDQVKHIISSLDTCPNRLALESVAAQTIRLGQVDAERYHTPFHDNTAVPQKSLHSIAIHDVVSPPNATAADKGMKIQLMPRFYFHEEQVVPLLDIPAVEQATPPEILELAKAARKAIEQDHDALQEWRQKIPRPNTEVITLGTGSALPSKYRNVSATLVRVPGVGNYLFDCGENTLGQLQRVFDPEELVDVLRNLRLIWISHLHADHHLGTTSVIKAWYGVVHSSVPVRTPPIIASIPTVTHMYGLSVISHEGMLGWLHDYSSVEDFGYSRILPLQISPVLSGTDSGSVLELCPTLRHPTYDGEHILRQRDYETVLGLSDIQACLVAHCRGAMAVSITFPKLLSEPDPLKISYSGDCRPSMKFVEIGRNSTVLIHEATFDDELLGDAKAKKHSTTSEALGIGAKMNAKAVVLTHFSQRYQKIPVLETVDNGEQEDPLLGPNGAEDVTEEAVVEEDVDVDVGLMADNMDMVTANATSSASVRQHSHPRPHPHSHSQHQETNQESNEQVIKVHSKDMKVAIAFDYMRVKTGDIAQLEKFTHALSKLFANPEEEKGESDESERNGNGKKTSLDGQSGKKKKAKRNN